MRQGERMAKASAAVLAVAMVCSLGACSEAPDEADSSLDTGSMATAGEASIPPIPVSMPKIAYTYRYGFEVAGDRIAELQQKQADLCEAQGPYTCRILSMSSASGEDAAAGGSLVLAVAADKARSFGKALATPAEALDGKQVSSSLEGEDMSKAMVDTEARLRARTVLRDRLLEVLRTRKGTVEELVEAERGVAAVNEEIDQARSWLSEMKGRVAFSRMEIAYEAWGPAIGFLAPVEAALGSVGTILGHLLSIMIVLLTIAIPVGGIVWAVRKLKIPLADRLRATTAD